MPATYQIKNKMLLVNGTVRHIIVFYGFTFSGKVRVTVNVECLNKNKKGKKKENKMYNKKRKKKMLSKVILESLSC